MNHPKTLQVNYIDHPEIGLVDINACDFDEKLHALPGDAQNKAAKAAPVKRKKRGRPAKTDTAES